MPRVPFRAALAALVVAVLSAAPALAREDGAPARALGMSDAVRSLGFGTSGLYFNPAAMSQAMSYAIDIGYGWRSWGPAHNAHLSFVDSKTNPDVGGGAGYTYTYRKKDDIKTQTHDLRFAVSSVVRGKTVQFCYGGGFRYMKIERDGPGTAAYDMDKWAPTLDLGVLLGVNDFFFIGVAAQNMLKMPVAKSPKAQERQPFGARSVGIGVGIQYSILHVGVDVDLDLQTKGENKVTASPMVGLELTLAQSIAIRAGYHWDRVSNLLHSQHRISAGLGYVSQYVGVDVGYAHDVMHASDYVIESSIRIFLP
jgi:opacity protein-like surface antigen